MDISFRTGNDKFNYRVCAIILNDGKILAMRDERSPYFYLPGGRVKLGETAEEAVIREIEEELNITARIVRPLWLNQAFLKRMSMVCNIMKSVFIFSWIFQIPRYFPGAISLSGGKESANIHFIG